MSHDAMTWDDTIEHDSDQFSVLPEGTECEFVVTEMEKSYSENKQCPMAVLQIRATALDGSGKTTIRENLVLHRDSEWRLCSFFAAIGHRKHGERLKPNWNRVKGAAGRCVLSVERWKKREDPKDQDKWTGLSNRIKKYLEPVTAEGGGEEPSFG